MKEVNLDTQEAGNKAFAARDASIKSYAASTAYNEAQKVQAERVKVGLGLVYGGTVYINYRKKFIAVKVEYPIVRSKKDLRLLEKDYEAAGIVKAVTPQGVTYRIPKQ